MRLISVSLARTVWFFDLAQFNPKGINLWPVCESLVKKYQFSAYPKNLLDTNAEKAPAFVAGSYINSAGTNIVVSLSVYNNGLAAEASSSTDDSDAFLQEVVTTTVKDFDLVTPPSGGKIHVSQLDVELPDFSVAAINPELQRLAAMLSDRVATVDGGRRNFEFGTLHFWTEDTNPATSPAIFRFERKIGLPFSSNRFFSQAALRTQEHLEFLQHMEESFKKTPVTARP